MKIHPLALQVHILVKSVAGKMLDASKNEFQFHLLAKIMNRNCLLLYYSDLEQTLTIGARFHHFFPSHRTTERVRRPSVLRPSIILRYIAVLGKEGSLIECEEKTRLRNRLCEHDCQF